MNRDPSNNDGLLSIEGYLDQLWKHSVRGWNWFWFSRQDPIVLGLIRLCTGCMLFYTHLVWGLRLEQFLGEYPILDQEQMFAEHGAAWASFWWAVPADLVPVVHWGCLLVFLMFALGCWTRVTSILAFVCAVSYANRLFFATFGLDQINTMLTFYLAIAPSGAALSVDQWRRARMHQTISPWAGQPSIGANLGIRLIQFHMCVIYFFAGVSKLEGQAWWDGYAMWMGFANYEYQTLDMTWLARYPFVWNAITHVTVIWEMFYCVLIWNRWLRPIMLFLAVLLHVGIGLCMGMWTFALIMIVGNAAFLSPAFVRRILRLPYEPTSEEDREDSSG